jgi:hypothetical protein
MLDDISREDEVGDVTVERQMLSIPFHNRSQSLRAAPLAPMIPRISQYLLRAAVEKLIHDAGLDEVQLVCVNDGSWSAAGRRPLA